jgi:hypothetical protein
MRLGEGTETRLERSEPEDNKRSIIGVFGEEPSRKGKIDQANAARSRVASHNFFILLNVIYRSVERPR